MSTPRTYRTVIPILALFLAAVWIISGWGFARFLHYHSQNRLLRPADYDAQVISASDYAALSNPDADAVKLSDGRMIQKSSRWQTVVLPNYKPLDDDRYVLVTLKGTAPMLPILEPILLPVLILLVLGLAVSVIRT